MSDTTAVWVWTIQAESLCFEFERWWLGNFVLFQNEEEAQKYDAFVCDYLKTQKECSRASTHVMPFKLYTAEEVINGPEKEMEEELE